MLDEMNRVRELELSGESPLSRKAASALAQDAGPLFPVPPGVHHGAFYAFAGLYGAMLLLFLLTFIDSGQTVFALGICTVYGLLFFGTPLVLYRVSGQTPGRRGWADFLDEKMETNTGMISGRAALVQICIVPAALLPFIAFMGVVIALNR